MKGQQLTLWVLAGAGVILMYSAYHNVSPTSLLAKYAGLSSSLTPLTAPLGNGGAPGGGSTGKGKSGGGGGGGGGGGWGDSTNPGNPTGGGLGGQYKVKANNTLELDPYSGQWQEVDANGYAIGAIPAGYQVSPGSYVGSGVTNV